MADHRRSRTDGAQGLRRIFPFLGIGGSVLVCVVLIVAALAYSGRQGEPYSPLNHFFSELGEVGVSRAAWLVNAGLIAGGALFVLFSIGLALHLGSAWGFVGMVAGIGAGAFLAGVGIFPMNRLQPHIFVAMWFFRMGLATVLLFGVAFAVPRRERVRVRRSAIPFSALALAAYAAFLLTASAPPDGANPLDPSWYIRRLPVLTEAVLEWAVAGATILWFLAVSLVALKGAPRSRGLSD